MGQVSLPIRIALLGALAFLVLWMVALKPKAAAEEAPAPAPAPQEQPATALGAAADDAKDAVAASEASAAAKEAAAEPPTAKPAAPAPVQPAPEPKAKPAAAPAQPTVVALVGTGEDDARARELVAAVDGARTFVVPIEEIERHRDLIGAVEIRQVPTILVIGADRRAQRIEGLADAAQLEQALAAAR